VKALDSGFEESDAPIVAVKPDMGTEITDRIEIGLTVDKTDATAVLSQ
jgi:hypothetical protein